ncbi:MAG: amino acid adenylation domain-containing protein [Acidobacteriota bacterium]|nr:amino acid adenylation domain-containing protein [Acidobacteriota bacterium]
MLLHHLLDQAAQRRPEADAVRCDGESLSWGELYRRANGIAQALQETGLGRRDRVAVLLGKGLRVPASFYGALAAGGVLVPIDPKSPAEQIARILTATGASHLVTEPQRAKTVRQALDAMDQTGGLETPRVLGLETEDEPLPWSSLLEQAQDRPPEASVIDTDPVYILHTSGSTGVPKLIQHTHRSALSFAQWAAKEYSLTPDDRLSNHSSHHTCFATFDYYAAARAGACTVILTPAVMMMPPSLATLLERERVSVWYSVPTALVHLSLRGTLEERDLSALRWVLFAGETFPAKHLQRLMQQLPEARFSHVYGSTEVNVCTYYHLPDYHLPGSPTSDALPPDPLPIGRPCSNARALVVDGDLRPVADGEEGELLIRGSTVMSGYWGDPERNRQVLVRRPADGGLDETYFRTGDRVRVQEDGNLAFVARADLQIKVRGHRVELGEIETALLSLPGIEEAAAFALPDGESSWTLRAAVVVATGSDGRSDREIVAGLKQKLPLQALPARILRLPALPRTPTGKVDRKALRRQAEAEEAAQDG